MTTQPLLSLIVLGFSNFEQTTHPCLDSLLPWAHDEEIEIIVVDNGSPDDSAQKTLEWCFEHPSIRCLISEHNRGYAGGMNWGVSHATGKWLLLVNNDTMFPDNTLDALKRVLRLAPDDVGMLGPVTNAAGNGQRLWNQQADFKGWNKIGGWLNQHPSGRLMPCYRCDFFTIAIRHDVWSQLGGLDMAFGLGYYEDFDFSLRLQAAGYQQMITEDVFILHVGSATFKGSKDARALIKKNKALLKSKHPHAKFEHTREANLEIIKAYQLMRRRQEWSSALQAREDLRIKALTEDAPRSWFKRLRWKIRVRIILNLNLL